MPDHCNAVHLLRSCKALFGTFTHAMVTTFRVLSSRILGQTVLLRMNIDVFAIVRDALQCVFVPRVHIAWVMCNESSDVGVIDGVGVACPAPSSVDLECDYMVSFALAIVLFSTPDFAACAESQPTSAPRHLAYAYVAAHAPTKRAGTFVSCFGESPMCSPVSRPGESPRKLCASRIGESPSFIFVSGGDTPCPCPNLPTDAAR